MENSINVNLSPIQALLSLAFQIWLIVFPIIIIRKLDYLTGILKEKFGIDQEESDGWFMFL